MKKSWFRIRRQYLSYSRSDRNAVIILSALILLVIIANRLLDYLPEENATDFSELKQIITEWEKQKVEEAERSRGTMFAFDPNTIESKQLDSLALPDYIKRNMISYRNSGGKFKTTADVRRIYGMNDSIFAAIESYIQISLPEKIVSAPVKRTIPIELHRFDPNVADLDELKGLGFSNYQATNLLAYRKSGGKIKSKEDLLKIYGVDSGLYLKLADYIDIGEEEVNAVEVVLPVISPLELNSADTLSLIELPGIGPAYARRIVRYRELLGGYYSKDQLRELYNFPEETYEAISDYLSADTLQITKLRINFLEYSELIRHPYLNKEQVNQLLEKRRIKGSYKNISELESIQAFDNETLRKLRPYITCQ